MSELKVYHHELRHNEYEEFYLKYEADKVIAEKDFEIDRLKEFNAFLKQRVSNTEQENPEARARTRQGV